MFCTDGHPLQPVLLIMQLRVHHCVSMQRSHTFCHTMLCVTAPVLARCSQWQVGTKEQEEQLKKMQAKYGVDGEQHTKQSKAQA